MADGEWRTKLKENLKIVLLTREFSFCPLSCLLNKNLTSTTTTVYVFPSLWHNKTQVFEVSEKQLK